MIEEVGTVVQVEGDELVVDVRQVSACASCSAKQGCGQAVLDGMSGGRSLQWRLRNTLGARAGDRVVLGIPEDTLMQASLRVYLLPLVLMLAGAVVMRGVAGESEGWVVLGGLAGLVLGFLLARRWSVSGCQKAALEPRLLRRAG